MKYLKTFESKWSLPPKYGRYKIGDYVVMTIITDDLQTFGKIIDANNQANYIIETKNGIEKYVTDGLIVRKMRKDEIENFEIEKDLLKYNL